MDKGQLTTIEEYWPGQKEGLRTARIELYTGQHYPLEVCDLLEDPGC